MHHPFYHGLINGDEQMEVESETEEGEESGGEEGEESYGESDD